MRDELDRLESSLRGAGCPELPAGLTLDEIKRRSSPFALPREVVAFFTWHNGFGGWVTPMPHAPVSLEMSVRRSLEKRAQVEVAAPGQGWDPDVIWPHSWFIFGISHDNGFVIDCAGSPDETKPVLHPELPGSEVVAPSLSALVTEWARLFEIGAYGWDPTQRVPLRIEDRMPDDDWHRAYF